MSLLSVLGISDALAASSSAAHQPGNVLSMFWLPMLIIVVFYFLLIRPQSKRAKEHKNLLDNLTIGDEVVTTGGILAKVTRLRDTFVELEVSSGVTIHLQKTSIASVVPKGTISSAQ